MHQYRLWLGSLLVLQLLLAAGIFLSVGSSQSDRQQTPLLTFSKDNINKLIISNGSDSESDSVVMFKQDNHWSLPGLENLPVDRARLDSTFTKLQGLHTNWPVATTTGSHQRFEVSETLFQRRIQLYQDDTLISTLFLGTSPGFRKAHVRSSDDDEVYALALNTYDFPSNATGWLDKSLLAAKDIEAITGADFSLKKADSTWALFDNNGDEFTTRLNEDKAQQLSQALILLQVIGVAEESPEPDPADVTTLTVSGLHDGHYSFFKKDDKYYVKQDRQPVIFTISQYDYDRIATIQLSDLILAEKDL